MQADPSIQVQSWKMNEFKYHGSQEDFDKFFNIEVSWTSRLSLETRTAAPYPIAEIEWPVKYLENEGKPEATLGIQLDCDRRGLCGDSFEEHVLGYPPEKTGLHLHSLNICSKEFKTLSTELVDAFADEWGFIKTPTINLNSIQEVRGFTNTCAETGEWNGGGSRRVNFDEPFMMYRDWREITKILSIKGPMTPSTLPKSKMKRVETKLYVKWVIQETVKDPASFKEYSKGKRIICDYGEVFENGAGSGRAKGWMSKDGESGSANNSFSKTTIVPVAIPGCAGKTSVSLALAHILGSVILKVTTSTNNKLKEHRQSLRDATSKFSHPVRLLALNWSLDQPRVTILVSAAIVSKNAVIIIKLYAQTHLPNLTKKSFG
ncbi:hypothetical protein BYT27DRAFT_7260914 [Phlegmacium glaucopus]|nr:hypothetical protein BYT27DRAFT_7260914 [Phlegmacium glaucopus]